MKQTYITEDGIEMVEVGPNRFVSRPAAIKHKINHLQPAVEQERRTPIELKTVTPTASVQTDNER